MPNENKADSPTPNPLLMEEIPQTLDQLNACIAKLFHCMTGPPMAYFDFPLDSRIHPQCGQDFERFVYGSLGWRTSDSRNASTEARLVTRMLEPFIDARRQLLEVDRERNALLFWRRPLAFLTYADPETSIPWTKLTCRLVIPGADLSQYTKEEGVLIPLL